MVNNESALRHSAVWACLRLRANLISTFPVDVYRKPQYGLPPIEIPPPPIIVAPDAGKMDIIEFLYSTQFDLDRAGNSVGIITEVNGYGLPARIELVPLAWVSCRVKNNRVHQWFIQGEEYTPDKIWHEKQYTVAGFHFGLSPIMYAAWCISEQLSIQDFALSWFTNGGIPRSHLRNTTLATPDNNQTDIIKARVKESVHSGDVLVTGKDWEYSMVQAEQTGMEWIEARKLGPTDIARFFDVPSDLIDAAVSGSNVTYANVVQRNIQFLTMGLGPPVKRRENSLNKLLPVMQYVKLNTDSLLRMDPKTRTEMLKLQIDSRILTPNEARLLDDREPLTDEQYKEFARFWPVKPPPGEMPQQPLPQIEESSFVHPPELLNGHTGRTSGRAY
jgi:HK97 family phage portal protein